MQQQLLEYFKDVCQNQFGDELVDIKVSFPVPHQAFVNAIQDGGLSPIPFEEIIEVSRISIEVTS